MDEKRKKNQIMEDNDHYDSVISLFSVSIFDKKNFERSNEKEIVGLITKIYR